MVTLNSPTVFKKYSYIMVTPAPSRKGSGGVVVLVSIQVSYCTYKSVCNRRRTDQSKAVFL